ncbi:MAG: Gldg family protein, partial [bacterium]|nr:Gldg family protein [bacterium]
MGNLSRIARKEFAGFFSSPIAFIFFGAFLLVTLFVFFWVETFFARNIADVRPLFEWMPILLVFLSAAITMRMWSEEQRAGTLEFLLTSPVPPLQLVLGKFFACFGLLAVALILTLPVPVTVSLIAPLDWGPVFGGYLATLFLAAAYLAIGLFVSARSDNQIISLLLASLLGGLFYALGSDILTGLFGTRAAEVLKLLGSGARFESITRGIIDARDLVYYLSIVGVFLTLNVYALERQRWAGNAANRYHRQWGLVTALFAINFLAVNLWLAPLGWVRADITAGRMYSISDTTRGYLAQLKEPLLIRGYFSAKTHPLLAPLVPRLRDLLEEYAVASGGRARVEFIDPLENPELEKEAGERYGIRPVPFQFSNKYQAAVVNSYFDVLIQYGDQYETLGFRDLIEVKVQGINDLRVELRNPEYDITRTIKKVLYTYQGSGDLFSNILHPVVFKGYVSPDARLPEPLVKLKQDLNVVLDELKVSAGDRLRVEFVDPDADGGALAKQLEADFGFRPMAVGLFNPNTFWFYLVLESNGSLVQVPLPEGLDKAGLERGVQAALKRFSKGFLKTVALHAPQPGRRMGMPMGMRRPAQGKRFTMLQEQLQVEHTVRNTDLKNGRVPDEADLLLLASPDKLDDKQLFAVDQFLMRGGTVILATAPFDVDLMGTLSASKHDSGLKAWLEHHGITLEETMVLDPQNSAFPIPVNRNVGGFTVRETRMVEYPYFVDIRADGMERDGGLTTGLDQITLNWPSPISLDMEKNSERRVLRLLESSAAAWTSDGLNIQPDFRTYGALGFATGTKRGRQLLAVAVEGRFESWFKGKPSPLAKSEEPATKTDTASPGMPGGDAQRQDEAEKDQKPVISRVIGRSPESARLILFASNTFLTDSALDLASSGLRTRYLNSVQLVENAVDWSLEDRDLLGIRGRAHFSRTLPSLNRPAQVFWEYLNYGLALIGLLLVWLIRRGV